MQVPLLIHSDSPTTSTGLGRITRELAQQIHEKLGEVFRVGVLGFGGMQSRSIPYPLYIVPRSMRNCGAVEELPDVWRDFAGDERGILLSIMNIEWLSWLAAPNVLPEGRMKSFVKSPPFSKWAYVPVDGDGPDGKLVKTEKHILDGFDRILAYTEFGAEVLSATTGTAVPHLPHGLDTNIFRPHNQSEARKGFIERVTKEGRGLVTDDVLLLGVIATNTPRKDWCLAFETCRELMNRGVEVGLWAHTDKIFGNWDLLTLADAFGMKNKTVFSTGKLSDEDLSWAYSACNATLGIGSGEGWGFPLAESLACGVPVVHGQYAGATEFVPKQFLVQPVAFRGDGFYCVRRPVFRASDWADKVMEVRGQAAVLPPRYLWVGCWPEWDKWLKAGVE